MTALMSGFAAPEQQQQMIEPIIEPASRFDWTAIVVALIALLGTIITVWVTKRKGA